MLREWGNTGMYSHDQVVLGDQNIKVPANSLLWSFYFLGTFVRSSVTTVTAASVLSCSHTTQTVWFSLVKGKRRKKLRIAIMPNTSYAWFFFWLLLLPYFQPLCLLPETYVFSRQGQPLVYQTVLWVMHRSLTGKVAFSKGWRGTKWPQLLVSTPDCYRLSAGSQNSLGMSAPRLTGLGNYIFIKR